MSAFEFSNPHVVQLTVQPDDIDAYDHVNNSVYLKWFDRAAWSHSRVLGVSIEDCVRMRRGMAAHRTEIDYVLAALLGDVVNVATWIVGSDHKLRVERRFQVVRVSDSVTLARARTDYVCINLDSGRASRMPEAFSRAYQLTPAEASQ
jgi:acyl-CoA thioester hydrolase